MKFNVFIRFRHTAEFVAVYAFCFCVLAHFSSGQQPFNTDDADVTEKGNVHLEVINEFDGLPRSSSPVKYQNGTRMTLAYGLAKSVEISVTGQFLTVISEGRPRVVGGIGDTTFAVKYNIREERDGSGLPAFSVSGFIQLPTGNADRGLSSGVVDYGINGIAQKTFKKKNIFRVNAGVLFSGNTLTGAIGSAVVRGKVFTGGTSYVREISNRLSLGAEITGALTSNFQLSKGQLQTQMGGNYQIAPSTTLDFGFIIGRFPASPRVGFQIGFSHDF